MLTSPAKPCRRWPAAVVAPALALLPLASWAQGGLMESPERSRPPTLLLLSERLVPGGKQATGIYAIETDPTFADVKRVKVWLELPNDVQVRTETIRCSPKAPMRVTSDGRDLIVRLLNPGGAITPANRLDHQIWWAVCHPALARQDPAGLRPQALALGYSGHLQESEQRVPQPSR